jgi:hypothetical protein
VLNYKKLKVGDIVVWCVDGELGGTCLLIEKDKCYKHSYKIYIVETNSFVVSYNFEVYNKPWLFLEDYKDS